MTGAVAAVRAKRWPRPAATLPQAGVSLADQDVAQLGGRMSVLALQKADHVKLDGLLDELAGAPADKQDAVLRRIYRLVFPHAFAEEAVLWPAIRRLLPDGEALTLRIEHEHQQINELVTRLEGLRPGSVDHDALLERIVLLLREDVRDEEDALLPRLQARASVTQLQLLGFAWTAVRRIAPTRPHPIVARRPPGNALSALPLSVLDRSRDRIDHLLQRGVGPAGRPLRAVSLALTDASHAVEQVPGMRSGEDPSTRVTGPARDRRRAAIAVVILAVAGTAAWRRRHAATPSRP